MNIFRLLFGLSMISIAISCRSTHITSSWREPDKEVAVGNLTKVLVVALFQDQTNRHRAEDQMAGYLEGKGVVSYSYFTGTLTERDEELARQRIRNDAFDGAVTMRLIDVDREPIFTPGDGASYPFYYRYFSGYYLRSNSFFNDPYYFSTTKTYTVETNVYSIKEDRIIWTGLTESTNPGGLKKLTQEIAEVVFRRMRKEGFIKK